MTLEPTRIGKVRQRQSGPDIPDLVDHFELPADINRANAFRRARVSFVVENADVQPAHGPANGCRLAQLVYGMQAGAHAKLGGTIHFVEAKVQKAIEQAILKADRQRRPLRKHRPEFRRFARKFEGGRDHRRNDRRVGDAIDAAPTRKRRRKVASW